MTNEHLLDAIGMLDDDLVAEAAAPVRRSVPRRALAGLAAAFVLCAGLLTVPQLLDSMSRNAGMSAAPESADGAAEDFYYTADQEMQLNADSALRDEKPKHTENLPSASVTSGSGTVAGLFEPRFITPRGTYLVVVHPTDASPTLPADAVSLGTLQQYPCNDPTLPATPTKSLVGSPVWESADGMHLYVQHTTGWFLAKLQS